jgi:hypothetical protein
VDQGLDAVAELAPTTPVAEEVVAETELVSEPAPAMSAEESRRRAVMERCLALRLMHGRGPR